MDFAQLAADTVKFIVPYLPYLIAGGKIAAKAAFAKTGENFSDAVWNKAVELWGKLKPKVDSNPNAQSAIEKAARKPDDKRVLGNLEVELEEIFENDQPFAQSIKAGDYSFVIGKDMNNSVATFGDKNLVASHGGQITQITNNYTNTPQSNAEKEKSQNAFRSYLEKLRRHCNALPLAALGGDDSDEDITLDKIYIDLDTTQFKEREDQSKKKVKNKESEFAFGDEKTPISVMEVAAETKKLVLLGGAGAGKSTFVKELLALQAAVLLGEINQPLAGFQPDLIPVLIVLRDLSPKLAALNLGTYSSENQKQALSDTILEKIREEIKAAEFIPILEKAFENGKILLVLDGLDEVPQNLRGLVRQAVGALVQLHKIERVIITSRSRSYTGQAVFQNFQPHTIAPFDGKKIAKFARAWYNEQCRLGHMNTEQAEKRAHDLASASSTSDLIEMSSNPMMLTSIAIIHQKDIGLPRERVRLYHLIVDVLISRWQKHKTGEENFSPSQALTAFLKDDDRLRYALQILAYEAHSASYKTENKNKKTTDADLSRGEALMLLEKPEYLGSAELASEFLDYVDQRSGLLVGKGGELERPTSYSFPHRTIQEYLAGCYLVSRRNRGRKFFKHAAEGDFWSLAALMGAEELFYNHPSTRDALLDLTYHLCPDVFPQTDQAERALLWSGQIACVIGNEIIERDTDNPSGGKAYLERLIPHTLNLLESKFLSPRERAEAGDTLAKLGDPRFDEIHWHLPKESLLGFIHIPAGEFLMGTKEEDVKGLIEKFGGDKDFYKNETPQHKPYLSEYYMARYPVTVAQFKEFINDSKYEPTNKDSLLGVLNHPVSYVTWYDTMKYCEWMTQKLKSIAPNSKPKNGMEEKFWRGIESGSLIATLPSEAEWEKAAHGDKDSRVFPWGDDFNLDKVNGNMVIGDTSPVGCFPQGKSPYELQDMSGNVWEWTRSLHKPYEYNPKDGRENLKADQNVARVLRGGSYLDEVRYLRCAYRYRNNPNYGFSSIGFRVVVCVSSPISL